MTLPQLMGRIWDGDPNEFFRYSDMNRVEYNANILARELGITQVDFIETTRASQFRYDEAQKLENLTKQLAEARGLTITIEPAWNYNRSFSYVDAERWESNIWAVYSDMGGIGDRIPNDKTIHTINAVLFAGAWRGPGPYIQDVDAASIAQDSEAIVYVSEDATASQRIQEYNAGLQAVELAPRTMRVYAHNIKPRENIPIKITTKAFKMFRSFVLRSDGWQGSGPWTQAVDMGAPVSNAVIGSDNRNNTKQIEEFTKAIIGASDISGSMVTIRAAAAKPSIDLNVTIMWSEDNAN